MKFLFVFLLMILVIPIVFFDPNLSAYGHEHDDYTPLIIQNPNPESTHSFGRSVSIFEDKILVGAYSNATNAPDAFLFDANTGNLLNTFNATIGKAFEDSQSVFLHKDWVLVGASREQVLDDSTGENISSAGAAYLFDAQTGELLHTFHQPTPTTVARFGNAVAIYDDWILIGAFISGNAYLFNANTGELIHDFVFPYDNAPGRFGESISISKDYALIGASQSGTAFLYDLNTGDFVRDYNGVQGFSSQSVSIDNEFVLLGKTGGGDGILPVYLYDVDGEYIQRMHVLTYADAKLSQDPVNFIEEDKVLISILNVFDEDYLNLYDISDVNNLINNIGRVFLYDAKTGGLINTFYNPDPQKQDAFGKSLSMYNDVIVIGASGDSLDDTNSGLVYVYEFQGSFSSLTAEIQDTSGNTLVDHTTNLTTVSSGSTTINLLTDTFTNESITIISDSTNNYPTTQEVVYVITITQNDEILSEQIISKTVEPKESISISLPFIPEKPGEYHLSMELWNNQQEKKSVVEPIGLIFTIDDPVDIIVEDETTPIVEDETTPIVEDETTPIVEESKIPSWIKDDTKKWVDGSLEDSEFTSGIQHLIKEKIVDVSITIESKPILDFVDTTKDPQSYIDRYNNEPSYKEWFDDNYPDYTINEATGFVNDKIPSWIKNTASWWAEGLLSEDDFLKGIEYLVEKRIIQVN